VFLAVFNGVTDPVVPCCAVLCCAVQERKKAKAEGLRFLRLTGADIKPHHWDAFYKFYRNTTDRKWGTPYLTKDFFHQLGERMGDKVLLVLAESAEGAAGHGKPIAGALNLIGSHALFGRNWGCLYGDRVPNLHFEVRVMQM
jgi:predicted N-acyltransferase